MLSGLSRLDGGRKELEAVGGEGDLRERIKAEANGAEIAPSGACACIMILPAITLPVWIWIWVAAIGIAKTVVICISSSRQHRLAVPHSRANKLTGLLLFCLPFALIWLNPVIPSIIVCAAATLSVK